MEGFGGRQACQGLEMWYDGKTDLPACGIREDHGFYTEDFADSRSESNGLEGVAFIETDKKGNVRRVLLLVICFLELYVAISEFEVMQRQGGTDCALPTRRTTGTWLAPIVLKMSFPSWPGTVVINELRLAFYSPT